MSGLIKTVLIGAPVFGLVFWYVVGQQAKIDTDMQIESSKFERAWSEMDRNFSKTKKDNEVHETRIAQANKELARLQEKQRVEERREENFRSEFDRALRDLEANK